MHAAFEHAAFEHTWLVAHWPVESQVWTELPEQRCALGEHDPEHVPAPVHTFAQVVVTTHCPDELHVSEFAPSHWVAPG